MIGEDGSVITYNGEVYNYRELRDRLRSSWRFTSNSDTETILAAHAVDPEGFISELRGMFAFGLWDERRRRFTAIRDRFGIKPFYYCIVDEVMYFASEAKALVPLLTSIETDMEALAQYLTFQYTLGKATMFAGISQLEPGHRIVVENGSFRVDRYWDVRYAVDFDHSPRYFEHRLRELLDDSIEMHLRSDVEVGAYVSGGIDSSLVGVLARRHPTCGASFFHGRFTEYPGYDESSYAYAAAQQADAHLHVADIAGADFARHLRDVVYHLDHPVAGPGSFPQFMVALLAAEHVKVVLGGQGGDEIFGGYTRYLIAYFEQCIKAAIEGNYHSGNFVVTLESIVPNLGVLREYTPLLSEFWRQGLFGQLDQRYFRLIDRSVEMTDEVDWDQFDRGRVFEQFAEVFNSEANIGKRALFDRMTRFDFKALLPALLHVEDRMSMAHGLESRVPLLDHHLVEFAATVPADVKFKGGQMKHLLKTAFRHDIPPNILARRDKMGFPVPLAEWFAGDQRQLVTGLLESMGDHQRPGINPEAVRRALSGGGRFSRKAWGLVSLEVWYQLFHDQAAQWRQRLSRSMAKTHEGTQ